MPTRALWGSWARRPFCSPISCRQDCSLHDLPWVPKGRFKQLLIKGGAAMKLPEARLKGPENLIKIRRASKIKGTREAHQDQETQTTWEPAHTLILSATPFWNCAEERRMQDCCCLDPYLIPLTTTLDYITSPYSPVQGGGGAVLEAPAYCVPSLPGKEIKPLFLFPP